MKWHTVKRGLFYIVSYKVTLSKNLATTLSEDLENFKNQLIATSCV